MGVSQSQKEAFQCLAAQPAEFVMCFFFQSLCLALTLSRLGHLCAECSIRVPRNHTSKTRTLQYRIHNWFLDKPVACAEFQFEEM